MRLFKKKKTPSPPSESPIGTQKYTNESGYVRMTHPGIKIKANAEERERAKRTKPKLPKQPKKGRGKRP